MATTDTPSTPKTLPACPYCRSTEFDFFTGSGWYAVRCAACRATGPAGVGVLKGDLGTRERIGKELAVTAYLVAQPPAVAAIPEGWKLVPIEPTQEMIDAGCPVGEQCDHFDMKTVYAAMLAAVLNPPVAQPPAGQQDRGEAAPTRSIAQAVEVAVDAAVIALREAGHRVHRAAVIKAINAFTAEMDKP